MSEKEIKSIPEESFAVGNVGKGDFIFVNLAGNRSTSSYTTDVVNDFHRNL